MRVDRSAAVTARDTLRDIEALPGHPRGSSMTAKCVGEFPLTWKVESPCPCGQGIAELAGYSPFCLRPRDQMRL
jgi:hypothetical protein